MKIEIKNLTKQFGDMTALSDLSITFQEGKLTTLLGPSGCGKSTLLNLISGILPPTQGTILFGEKDVTRLSPDKRNLGLVFQNYALYPHMTVRENIMFPLEIKKISKGECVKKVKQLAEMMQISDYLNRRPAQLSGGQQQRVAIARALAKEPDILLLDEPLSNLDARLRLEMREEIRRIQQEIGITTIFVTHDQEEAMSISDQVVLLCKGELQQNDIPQNLYSNPQNAFVADFLGNPPINMIEGIIDGDVIILDNHNTMIKYHPVSQLDKGTTVKVGIRSEMFLPVSKENASFNGTVTNVFLSGKDILYKLRIGTWEVRATFTGEKMYQVGEEIPLGLRRDGIYLFDLIKGRRIL